MNRRNLLSLFGIAPVAAVTAQASAAQRFLDEGPVVPDEWRKAMAMDITLWQQMHDRGLTKESIDRMIDKMEQRNAAYEARNPMPPFTVDEMETRENLNEILRETEAYAHRIWIKSLRGRIPI